MDYKDEVTAEGYQDMIHFYNHDRDRVFETIEHYLEDVEGRITEGVFDEASIVVIREYLASMHKAYLDYDELFEVVGDADNMRVVYMKKVAYVVPNTCFLTKQDAKDYLSQYGYNHTAKAHTYAMTAIRSPKMEKLMHLLETNEWANV